MSIKYSIPAEKRDALAALSKEVYGASSRYLKLMDKGRLVQKTEEVTELVPRDDDSGESDERKVQVPVRYGSGGVAIYERKRYSLEEVESEMTSRKKMFDEIKASIEAQKAEQEAARAQAALEDKIAREFSGSVS